MKKLFYSICLFIFINASFFNSLNATCPIFDLLPSEDLNRNVIFDELKVSKGGQFSEKSYIALIDSIPLESNQLIIFDLRDECHGLINGMPVHWKESSCCAWNRIEELEHKHLKKTQAMGHTWIEEKDQTNQLDLSISQALTEREFVENYGHYYVRVPMADGDLPDNLLVDQFIKFINNVAPEYWIHFHCHTGGEKATTFLVLSEIIKNNRQITLEDVLAKHELISEMDMAQFCSEETKMDLIQQKLNFISEFYTYCQEVPDFSFPWSKWVLQSPLFGTNRANKHHYSPHNSLDLVDRLQCGGYDVGVCVEWDGAGHCTRRITVEVNDNNGNYLKGKAEQKDGKNSISVNGGNKGGK